MFQATIYLLSCSMVLTTVMSSKLVPTPTVYNGFKYQCQARGPYVGACNFDNTVHGEITCNRLVCAKYISKNVYEACPTGPVLNMTRCGEKKVCLNGLCKPAGPSGVPPLLGPGLEYVCSPPENSAPEVQPKAGSSSPTQKDQEKKTSLDRSPEAPAAKKSKL